MTGYCSVDDWSGKTATIFKPLDRLLYGHFLQSAILLHALNPSSELLQEEGIPFVGQSVWIREPIEDTS